MSSKCYIIPTSNYSLIGDGSNFGGITSNVVINIVFWLFLVTVFILLKRLAWPDRNKEYFHLNEVGWLFLFYGDIKDIRIRGRNSDASEPSTEDTEDLGFLMTLLENVFFLSNQALFARCGSDAVQYLSFLRALILFSIINTVICLVVIIPVNLKGGTEVNRPLFYRLTISNLDNNSDLVWIHVIASFLLTMICFVIMRQFSRDIEQFRKSSYTKRTVEVKHIKSEHRDSGVLKRIFMRKFPHFKIEDIKLVHDVQKLTSLYTQHIFAEEAKKFCDYIYETEERDVIVKHKCWFCFYECNCICGCRIDNGAEYYGHRAHRLEEQILKEISEIHNKVLDSAFVTFKTEEDAQAVIAKEPKRKREWKSSDVDYKWKIVKASNPRNIIWENLTASTVVAFCNDALVNGLVFIIAVFLTTPAIVISYFKIKFMTEQLKTLNSFISEYLPTLITWALSFCLPAIVSNSNEYMYFKTKSAKYISMMTKTVLFLLFAVIILPALGMTSVMAFFMWTIRDTKQSAQFQCMFESENVIFFVNYVCTSAFVGTMVQLIRIPEILYCLFYVLISKSEAERYIVRKDTLWEFTFGEQYAWVLLIFMMINIFSVSCPIIAPFGLLYMCFKFYVDRYNIYFCYARSRVSYKIHSSAIKFVFLALILTCLFFLFLLIFRSGFSNAIVGVYFLFTFFAVMACLIAMCPGCCECCPNFCMLPLPEKKPEFVYNESFIQRYAPKVFEKYLPMLQTLDEYENPLPTDNDSHSGGEKRKSRVTFAEDAESSSSVSYA